MRWETELTVWTNGSITYFVLYGDIGDENATVKHHVKKITMESNQGLSAPNHKKKHALFKHSFVHFISLHSMALTKDTHWHYLALTNDTI